jgi:hypothetical protein
MFQLTAEELAALRSQIATSNASAAPGRGGRRYLPYAFTEHGAIMAATILNSTRAVEMSVYVVRAFVKLRDLLSSNRELARRFAQLETRLDKKLTEHDEAIAAILSAIRQLMGKSSTHQAPADGTSLNSGIAVNWRRRGPSVTQSKPTIRRGQQPQWPDQQKLQVLEERGPLALDRMPNELADPRDHKYRD